MSLAVFICGQSLHFPQGVTLEWSCWFAVSFFKRWSERDLFILKHNFHLISSDPKLSKIFKQKPTVTYRKNKSLSDHLLKNDIANQQLHSNVTPCGKCKLCPQINTAKLITNDKLNITEKIKGTGNCKEREIIYAAQCSRRKVLHIGHTGEQLSERFSKHR